MGCRVPACGSEFHCCSWSRRLGGCCLNRVVSWASRVICTSYGVRPKSPRRVSFKEFCKAQTLRKVSFKEAWNAKALGGCRLKAANYLFWYYFAAFRTQGCPDASNGAFRYRFEPLRAQGWPDAPSGQSSYHFGARGAQIFVPSLLPPAWNAQPRQQPSKEAPINSSQECEP